MKEFYSKLDSTQKMVVKLFSTTGYRVYRPATQLVPTGYTALYRPAAGFKSPYLVPFSCKIASATGYRVYRPGTGYTALVQLIRPQLVSHPTQSIQLCVDSGAGRQQVSTNMASTDWLQSLQITIPVYRLYSLIFTKTGCRVITSTTGYRACQQGTGYTTLLHQNRLQSLLT